MLSVTTASSHLSTPPLNFLISFSVGSSDLSKNITNCKSNRELHPTIHHRHEKPFTQNQSTIPDRSKTPSSPRVPSSPNTLQDGTPSTRRQKCRQNELWSRRAYVFLFLFLLLLAPSPPFTPSFSFLPFPHPPTNSPPPPHLFSRPAPLLPRRHAHPAPGNRPGPRRDPHRLHPGRQLRGHARGAPRRPAEGKV